MLAVEAHGMEGGRSQLDKEKWISSALVSMALGSGGRAHTPSTWHHCYLANGHQFLGRRAAVIERHSPKKV
jgi:hypothetical protein